MRSCFSNFAAVWLSVPFLALLASCAQSAEERQAAEAEHARMAIVHEMADRTIRIAGQRCPESPEEFRRLLLEHQEYVTSLDGKPLPTIEFVSRVRLATARHDSTKSCTALVDSVARAMHSGPKPAGVP